VQAIVHDSLLSKCQNKNFFPISPSLLSSYCANGGQSAQDTRLAHVAQHARMDQILPRRGGERVGERRFFPLPKLAAER